MNKLARWFWRSGLAAAALAFVSASAPAQTREEVVLRVGHFPNITHMQALVAHQLSRQNRGWFESRLGPGVRIEWYVYNAGPSAIEALLARSIDLTFVGPNPAINAFVRARGEGVRILAGAVNGGSALVVQSDSTLKSASDFRGRMVITPQFGNTQDVAARAWLASGGLRITQTGGDARVVPAANPDMLTLFKQKQADAAWTIEPWVSRLEAEAGGKVLVDDRDAITTVVAAHSTFLAERAALVRRFVEAHRELTDWIVKNPEEAKQLVRAELEAETRVQFAPELIDRAYRRLQLTANISSDALKEFVANAQKAGFLRDAPDMTPLVHLP